MEETAQSRQESGGADGLEAEIVHSLLQAALLAQLTYPKEVLSSLSSHWIPGREMDLFGLTWALCPIPSQGKAKPLDVSLQE